MQILITAAIFFPCSTKLFEDSPAFWDKITILNTNNYIIQQRDLMR